MRVLTPATVLRPTFTRTASPRVLAVEIGGTTTRINCLRPGHSEGPIERIPTPNYLTHPRAGVVEILGLLGAQIAYAARAMGAGDADVVVIAWPGPVIDGVALRSPTILGPDLDRRHDVSAQLRAHFPRSRVHVLNDLTCAGYHYVSRGFLDFCIVTVGSGIGNKVFLGGQPQIGAQGFGGEIGHLRMRPGPEAPLAAQTAELGNLASGRGTLWLAQSWNQPDGGLAHGPIEPEESEAFVDSFRAGDPRAVRIVEAGAHPLAVALGALHLGIGLPRFIVVGGFAKALGEPYRDILVRLCREHTWDVGQDWDRMIMMGTDGCDEGLSGALHFGSQRVLAALEC
jgi:C7-cyclitol 7-kinase